MSQNFSKLDFENGEVITGPGVRASCLLIGYAPPHSSTTALHVARLSEYLRSGGVKVEVMSTIASPVLKLSANFASEAGLRQSLDHVVGLSADHVYLYPAALNFGDCTVPGWFSRRREEIRRLRFAFALGRKAKKMTLVAEPLNHRFRTQIGVILAAKLSMLGRGKSARIKWRDGRLGQDVPEIADKTVQSPPGEQAERRFLAHCPDGRCDGAIARLTPAVMRHAVDLDRSHEGGADMEKCHADLKLLSSVASEFPADKLKIIADLRRQAGHMSLEFDAPPSSRAYMRANWIAAEGHEFDVPLTNFMKHVRAALRLEAKFPLNSQKDCVAFLTWYRENGPAKACGGALPERPPKAEPRANILQGVEIVSNFDQLDSISALDNRPFPVPSRFLVSPDCLPNGRFDLEAPGGRIAWMFEQIVARVSDGRSFDDLGERGLAYFKAPLGDVSGQVSRFEVLMALQCRRALRGGRDFLTPWDPGATRTWFRRHVLAKFPAFSRFQSGPPKPRATGHSFDLVGLHNRATGIAVNLQMSKEALSGLALNLTLRDAENRYVKRKEPRSDASKRLTRPVALHHLNADRIPQALVAPAFACRPNLYNIGFLLWEFEQLPAAHLLALDMLDEIWVPTRFLEKTYRRECDRPVVCVGKGIQVPDVPKRALQDFKADPAGFTFLTCFDFHSSVERKNPLAAVRAFQSEFPNPHEDVQMIVKTTPRQTGHWGDPEGQMEEIKRLARRDKRIKLLDNYLPKADFFSLIRSVDCLISPHRAEGFGYVPAYALSYGIPVVNTDHSGVTDYCTPETSFPVSCKLVDVPKGQSIYAMDGARWADIQVDDLAQKMRFVASNLEVSRQRAAVGQALMRDHYSIRALRARYVQRLAAIGVLLESDLQICS